MEQKKLLLVFVSVGVFLVIVLGAGILWFKPRPKPAVEQAMAAANPTPAPGTPASADPSEWVRNPQAVPGLQPQAPAAPSGASTRGDVIIIYGERPNTNISSPASAAPASADGNLQIQVPAPQPSAVPAPPEPPKPYEPQAVAKAPKPAPKERPAIDKAPPKKPAAAKAAPNKGDEFWIQTGSFSAKARADAAKEILSGKGIASLVVTKDVSGKTYFRVRVGPYSSKSEADYWLSLVKTIEGFDGSYVSQMKAVR